MKIGVAVTALLLLAACEARVGKDGEDVSVSMDGGNATAAAQNGMVSIDVPGFEMKVNIPENVRQRTGVDGDNVIYPGSAVQGIDIRARGGAEGNGVNLAFSSADPADKIAAWYRDPAREKFTVTSATKEGEVFVIAAEDKDATDRDTFFIRLTPRAGGGTDGRVTIRDTNAG